MAPESPGTENFSTPGDSGAVVVVGLGHVGGLLSTEGSGVTGIITYATPIDFLLKSIKTALGYRVRSDTSTPTPTRSKRRRDICYERTVVQ